uniref:DGCR8 n=1 Tax=Macrostomum lignano TaxID=282301 RepID=A0A1I8FFA1_9PLAT
HGDSLARGNSRRRGGSRLQQRHSSASAPSKNHRRQFYGVRIPVEEDPENFVPVANADSPANATRRFRSIDREFAPKPPFRLPPSWIPIDHTSGLTMYLHKPTKVVTLARPYFAGSVALRNHLIPVACLPCLGYRRGLESCWSWQNAAVAEDSPPAAPAAPAAPAEDSDAEEGEITSSEDGNDSDDADKDKKKER